jgi:hypothetical protein
MPDLGWQLISQLEIECQGRPWTRASKSIYNYRLSRFNLFSSYSLELEYKRSQQAKFDVTEFVGNVSEKLIAQSKGSSGRGFCRFLGMGFS